MITMSALPRKLSCNGALVLPQAEVHSAYADAGNEDHDELMGHVLAGTLPPKLAKLVPAGARPEVKIGFDVATGVGRIIGEGSGRDYGTPGPFEIVGSIDVLGVDDDAVVIVDWKTGFLSVDPAERNWQMWGYALAAARALGKNRAIVRIVYTKQPGQPVDEHELDALDLADFAARLKQLHVREAQLREAYKRGEIPTTREGSWCKHCASKSVCASKNGLLVQIAERGLAVIGDTAMTPERAASAYQEIVRIEQLVKDAKARLNAFVDERGPIALADGKMYGRYQKNGTKRLNGDVAVQAIAEIVGESAKEFESVAIERSTSQAAIERAAKQFAPKRGAAKMKAQIVARIDELGGVTYGADSYPYGEFVGEPSPKPALDMDDINRQLEAAG